jgi:DNA-binding beta-propeller fold protein YncE
VRRFALALLFAALPSLAAERASGATADSTATDSLSPATESKPAVRDSLRIVRVLIGPANESSRITRPSGIAIDAFGRMWITDEAEHRVQRFEADGRFEGEAGALGSDPGQLRRPASIALHGSASLAVLDRENRRVVVYDLFARRLGDLVDFGALEQSDPIGRIEPLALATDRGGALYVADVERDRIVRFDVSGAPTGSLGGFGARPGAFRGLAGIAVGPHGEVVAAERVNARVQVLDAGGRVLRSWSLPVRPGREALPAAMDDAGRVAIADEATGRLWLFAADGRELASLAGLGGPSALAFSRAGTLIVCERRLGRVIEIALGGPAR